MAPNVLAIVFKLKMAELVSSISLCHVSKIFPLLVNLILILSISAVVTLNIRASKVEQSADIPIVSDMAMINSLITGGNLILKI